MPYSGFVPKPLSPNALDRRIKRWLAPEALEVYIQAIPGLEQLTFQEATNIAPDVTFTVSRGGVTGVVSLLQLYSLNLSLRTAQRVLLRLTEGWAGTEEALFNLLAKHPWELQFGFAPTFRLHATARSAALQPGDQLTKLITDAIARRYEELGHPAPQVGNAGPEIYVRLFRNRCQVSMNTSGMHLHIRGVRTHTSAAPLRETLAAALVMTLERQPALLIDPFCGGGTILLEAATIGQPAGRGFGFLDAAWHQPGRFREAQRQRDVPPTLANTTFYGSDLDPRVIAAARHNLGNLATVQAGDATELDINALAQQHGAKTVAIVTNLPYGKRVGDTASAEELAHAFVQQLRTAPPGTELVVLTAHPAAFSVAGIEVITVQDVENGGLTVQLVHARVA